MGKKRRFSSSHYHREKSVKLLIAGLTGLANTAYAVPNPGLIGGSDDAMNAYAAFLNSNDQLVPISGLPDGGNSVINAVSINSLGTGLLAGRNNIDGYAAFVDANGIIVPFSFSFANGALTTAGINASGLGLVGGYSISSTGYAAYLSPDGTITSLPIAANIVQSTAINDAGVGLVGGEGGGAPYATYASSNGTLTSINTPNVAGRIYTVAINNLGNGVIGGWADPDIYAAFVTPDGTATPLSSLPSGFGIIVSAAINTSGNALIGGFDPSSNAYLGSVAPNGAVTPLFNTPFTGSINYASLNDSGTGLVAGDAGGNVYASLVQPNGNLIPLFNSSTSGSISAVALNKEGIGLISGDILGPYLALVAPGGTLTPISVANIQGIQAVALTSFDTIVNQAVPSSTGPYGGPFYTQLAATSALNTHFIQKNKIWSEQYETDDSGQNPTNIAANDELLAYNDGLLPGFSQNHLAMNPKTKSQPLGTAPICKHNSLWIEPFGNYVHTKGQGSVPASTNEIGGILLGYDREESNYLVGVALGYAYDYVHYAHNLGHGNIQEEMASLYGSYYTDHFWLAAAVWGGVYQLHNKRHTLSHISSKGHTHGWILDPHLELASPWQIGHCNRYYIEPFISIDWIKNWQHSYTESGASGLNLQMPSIDNSLLQSEAGLRFYERFVYGWGDFCLEEKISYINQTPYDVGSATTSFVNSASTFPIAVGSSKVQNLGGLQILGAFVPRCSSVYGGFSLEAAAGNAYQTYFGSLFCGVDF